MSDDYTVIPVQAGRVLVIIHNKCEISQEEVVKLLVDSGVDAEKIEFVEFEDLATFSNLDGAPCIIPVDDNVIEDEGIQQIAASCANSGGAAIVVFGADIVYTGTHRTADDFGTQCGWNPDALNRTLTSPSDAPPTGTDNRPTRRTRPSQVPC